MNCAGTTMRARTGARSCRVGLAGAVAAVGLAHLGLGRRQHLAERKREVEGRVRYGAEVRV